MTPFENNLGSLIDAAEKDGESSFSERDKAKTGQQIRRARRKEKEEAELAPSKNKSSKKVDVDPGLKSVTDATDKAESAPEGIPENLKDAPTKTSRTEQSEDANASPKYFEKGQEIQVEFDGKMVGWKILGFKDNGDPIIQGSAPGHKNGKIIFADWDDIKRWNPSFTVPEMKKPEPKLRVKTKTVRPVANETRSDRAEALSDRANPPEGVNQYEQGQILVKARQKRQEAKDRLKNPERVVSAEATMTELMKVVEGLEENVKNQSFAVENMSGDEARNLHEKMVVDKDLSQAIAEEYQELENDLAHLFPGINPNDIPVPFRVVLDNLSSKIKSDPSVDSMAVSSFIRIMNEYDKQRPASVLEAPQEKAHPETKVEEMDAETLKEFDRIVSRFELAEGLISDMAVNVFDDLSALISKITDPEKQKKAGEMLYQLPRLDLKYKLNKISQFEDMRPEDKSDRLVGMRYWLKEYDAAIEVWNKKGVDLSAEIEGNVNRIEQVNIDLKKERPTPEQSEALEKAFETPGFEEFLSNDIVDIESRTTADLLTLFEVFKNRERVQGAVSSITEERFKEITGLESVSIKEDIAKYLDRAVFEDPQHILKYVEQVEKAEQQQKEIAKLEAEIKEKMDTLPGHAIIKPQEFEENFTRIPELAKYFGPADERVRLNQKKTDDLIESGKFWKIVRGNVKYWLFDIPYNFTQYSGTLFGMHKKEREEARKKIAESNDGKYDSKAVRQHKEKYAKMNQVSRAAEEIQSRKAGFEAEYASVKDVVANEFLGAEKAIKAARRKIVSEISALVKKTADVSGIAEVQKIFEKNQTVEMGAKKEKVLRAEQISEIQEEINRRATALVDERLEKILSGKEQKNDLSVFGKLKESLKELEESKLGSLKKEEIKKVIRGALDRILAKTKDKIVKNRVAIFVRTNKL